MSKVMTTVLKGANFGEYDWAEAVVAEFADGSPVETISDFEDMLDQAGVEWEKTDELSGRIHNEYGPVYKFRDGECEGQPTYAYQMAWIEEN